MKRIITILVVVILIGLVAFRLVNNKEEIDANNQVKEDRNTSVSVNTAVAKNRLTNKNLSLLGTLTANQEIDVKAETQGKITSLNVELGDYVKRGQIIARIDNRLQSIAEANAEQSLADAKQNYQRYKNLYEGGAASQAQFDQYKLAYDNAQNQVEQAKKELSNAVVVAPISGQITEKAVEAGSFANVGTSIVTVVDVSKLKVDLSVAENDVYALETGDSVSITSSVYPGITYNGIITFISPRGDESHNYPIEVAFTNQDEHPLKAGTYVNVGFNKKNQTPTLQIPREALVGSVRNAQVYLVENDAAVLRSVTIGNDNGSYLEVLKGLKEGDRVVTTGQINLTDSAKVKVIQ